MIDGEEKVVQSAIGGEASAFGLLYDHYQPRIYRFVAIKVGRREDAEDLTHQVFMSAWQHIKTYRHRGFPFSSWLYQIARNQVIDFYRASKKETSLEDTDPEQFASEVNVHVAVDRLFELESIEKAIRTLKSDYQDVLILRFVEDLSIRETANAMKKSEGAIKLIQHRAIKALQELFDGTH